MSTLRKNAAPLDVSPDPSGPTVREVYGGENLPVLITLPDLTAPARPEVPVGEPAVPAPEPAAEPAELASPADDQMPAPDTVVNDPAEAPATPEASGPSWDAAEDVDDSVDDSIAEREAEAERERRRALQRQRRSDRAQRRTSRRAAAPAWLRNLGQLGVALVLASVLFAVIVTVKNWNRPGEASVVNPDNYPMVEAPVIDFGEPGTGPTAEAGDVQQPSLTLPDYAEYDSPLERVTPTDLPESPARETAVEVVTESSVTATPTQPQYPTTGVPELSVPTDTSQGGSGGWRETLPVGPVRSADRPATPPWNQHR